MTIILPICTLCWPVDYLFIWRECIANTARNLVTKMLMFFRTLQLLSTAASVKTHVLYNISLMFKTDSDEQLIAC